jgi:hypothetical protein
MSDTFQALNISIAFPEDRFESKQELLRFLSDGLHDIPHIVRVGTNDDLYEVDHVHEMGAS